MWCNQPMFKMMQIQGRQVGDWIGLWKVGSDLFLALCGGAKVASLPPCRLNVNERRYTLWQVSI